MWVYPEIQVLGDIPRYHARERGDAVALIGGGAQLTYAEVDQRSSRVANALLALDLAADARIGWYGRNYVELADTLWGAAKAGYAFMPVNWRLAPREVGQLLADSACAVLFVEDALADAIAEALAFVEHPPQVAVFTPGAARWLGGFADAAPDTDPRVAVSECATALQMYTSGTTGLPKGVELTHSAFNHMRLIEHLDPGRVWEADDSYLMFMPNFHMSGVGWLIQNLHNGIRTTILPQYEPGAALAAIRETRPTLMLIVPTALQALLDHPDAAHTDFTCLKLLAYAGSQMPLPLIERALTLMQCGFLNCYGATELLSTCTWLRPEEHDLTNPERLKSVGSAMPLVEIRLLDPEGQPVPDGEVGEIVVRMPSVFKGYWRNPEATAAVLKDGWYHTGDAATRDGDGFYYLKDRIKDMIVSGGENIYSSEVEAALVRHPAVAETAVIGVPDARWGEAVKALIILAPGESVTADDLVAHCRLHIAGYKVPKHFAFVTDFPRTPSGKVQKAVLRREHGPAAGGSR
ncbi:MAG: long-chain-fatty-acid--CoA ligase [Pseudomonadota bacterium]